MTQQSIFGNARWVAAAERTPKSFTVLRGHFTAANTQKVLLDVLGLGFFKCYINGVCINPDTFLPLSSDYEASCDPVGEVLSGHRVYVPQFDVTPYVTAGDNVIALHFGGGWYTAHNRTFGLPKAIYRLTVHEADGVRYFESDESCTVGESFVDDYLLICRESHSYSICECFGKDFDDSTWCHATLTESLDTQYCRTDCPADTLIETLCPVKVGQGKIGTVYDCGKNTTGYPVLDVTRGEVTVLFSEALTADGHIDLTHHHNQKFTVKTDSAASGVQPQFTWFGFRYFEIVGDAVPTAVKVVHAPIPTASSFHCDNETLNWIYDTFLHTMRCNMHTGHPSDCPHIERRGYTGDGQLTCHAVLSIMEARAFYEKWLADIADGQDKESGHIQYTAPYIRSGGGPGGWGCAIVEVPWQLYRHYGDPSVLEAYYPNMCRYIDYLKAHSEFGLVTSDKAGEWCLGDWCGPNILYPEKDITYHNQQVILPAPMVNTYFMVKSLLRLYEIANLLGKDADAAEFLREADLRKRAIEAAYFNRFDGNFIMNVQGANAFAADLGLGNAATYSNMVEYYQKLGYYDTGIFATDILTRVLFEHGDGELAVELMIGNGTQGFAHWRENGATTFHEYWDSNRSRSHNHPMFGAPVAYLLEFLLGIRQREHTAGYKSLVIAPQATSKFGHMSGSMQTPQGTVFVAYEKISDGTRFTVRIPKNTNASFCYGDKRFPLHTGENTFTL